MAFKSLYFASSFLRHCSFLAIVTKQTAAASYNGAGLKSCNTSDALSA
jgi:hypothetical protein